MKTLLLATAASALLAVPAFAQTQTPTPPTQQTQPAKPATAQAAPQQSNPAMGQPMQEQANAMQDINPNTLNREQVQKIQQALDKDGFGAGRTTAYGDPKPKRR